MLTFCRKKLIPAAGRDQVSKLVKMLVMQVRTELQCVMPKIPFQTDIENWYLNQDETKQNAIIFERMEFPEHQHHIHTSNNDGMSGSDIQKYFVKYRSEDNKFSPNHEDVLFLVPIGISRLLFPHIDGDTQFTMSTICVERMMHAIVRNSADIFWTLTVQELIQLLRASRTPANASLKCGAMKYVHICAARILNWRIIQAYDVSAAEDFMKVSFLLSAEDGADIAWSQWTTDNQTRSHFLEIPFGMNHTFDEDGFQQKGIVIVFGRQNEEEFVKVAVDVHVARLRSVFVQGLLSFPSVSTLPMIDLRTICTEEAKDVFTKFFVYYLVPESVSIECALQLWEVSEWMQVRKSKNIRQPLNGNSKVS
jgi:hypothetical protein